MSMECTFMHPGRAIFGQEIAQQIGEYVKELGGEKAFVVTDEEVATLEVFKSIEKSLKEKNVNYHVYADVDANPTDVQVEKGVECYKREKTDVLVAVGGGSSIDSAKAMGILVNNGGSIRDYEGMDLFANPIPPLIAIPTTAGTGSEVTPYSVITNTDDNYKMAPSGWKLVPMVALVDPVMMASMPPNLTAATGMDALSHAIEAVYSNYAMPQTDALAYASMKLVVRHLGPAVADGSNMEAREGMAMASLMAGMAMCAGCGGVHALGHQLSNRYGMPHGMAMSIMMPVIMRFNMTARTDRIADIAVAMGEEVEELSPVEAAKKAVYAVHKLAKSIGLPTTLSEYGADPKLIPVCAERASKDGDLPGNPVSPTLEQIEDLYKKAFEGNFD